MFLLLTLRGGLWIKLHSLEIRIQNNAFFSLSFPLLSTLATRSSHPFFFFCHPLYLPASLPILSFYFSLHTRFPLIFDTPLPLPLPSYLLWLMVKLSVRDVEFKPSDSQRIIWGSHSFNLVLLNEAFVLVCLKDTYIRLYLTGLI